jgi:hypothetical protein
MFEVLPIEAVYWCLAYYLLYTARKLERMR